MKGGIRKKKDNAIRKKKKKKIVKEIQTNLLWKNNYLINGMFDT